MFILDVESNLFDVGTKAFDVESNALNIGKR